MHTSACLRWKCWPRSSLCNNCTACSSTSGLGRSPRLSSTQLCAQDNGFTPPQPELLASVQRSPDLHAPSAGLTRCHLCHVKVNTTCENFSERGGATSASHPIGGPSTRANQSHRWRHSHVAVTVDENRADGVQLQASAQQYFGRLDRS